MMRLPILIFLSTISLCADGYVGPGLGLGVIGAIIGGALALLLAIAGVIWYPIKRLKRKLTPATPSSDENSADDATEIENDKSKSSDDA